MKKVLITGVFDLLHQEHLNFLHKARNFVDGLNQNTLEGKHLLLVGLESDQRVKALKGPDRPIRSAQQRQAALEKLKIVDRVFVLPAEFGHPEKREQLIANLQPTHLLVSASTPYLAEKQQLLEKYGGQVIIIHQYNPKYSTTKLITAQQKGIS